jgi:hypothetical protein
MWDRYCGYHISEDAIVFAVKRYLRTESQKRDIQKRGLSVRSILKGLWEEDQNDFCMKVLTAWNRKLGWKEFRVDKSKHGCYHLWE